MLSSITHGGAEQMALTIPDTRNMSGFMVYIYDAVHKDDDITPTLISEPVRRTRWWLTGPTDLYVNRGDVCHCLSYKNLFSFVLSKLPEP